MFLDQDLIPDKPYDDSYKNKKNEPSNVAKHTFEMFSKNETDKDEIRKKVLAYHYECMMLSITYWQEIIKEGNKLCK